MASHRDASTEPTPHAGELLRFGTVASVDLAAAKCTVKAGDLETGPIRWFAGRAGATRSWSPPTVGEQVLLICPEGDMAAGIALRGIYWNAHPAPGNSARELIEFTDGTVLAYDPVNHGLEAVLAAGATARIVAPGGMSIEGDVTITGTLTASGDVLVGNVSLKKHVHTQVQAGSGVSGKPQ